jgi:hypothetical protein
VIWNNKNKKRMALPAAVSFGEPQKPGLCLCGCTNVVAPTPSYNIIKLSITMNYVNIKREMLSRLAIGTLAKKKGLPLRTVHMNCLLLVFELGKREQGLSAAAIFSMLARLKRGSDFYFLQKILKDLQSFGLIDYDRAAKIKRYYVTGAGKLSLNDFERSLRTCRIDRRLIDIKTKKTK